MKVKLYILELCAIMLLFASSVHAQTTMNVPSSGSQTITTCNATIYDPGGTGQYPNSCDGYLVIQPANPSCVARLQGTYNTESSFDKIYVYEGVGTGGTAIVNAVSGSGSIDVTSSVGALTLRFTSDGSVQRDGFAFTATCTGGCTCGGSPSRVQFSAADGGVQVSWAASFDPDVSAYIVEYGPQGFTPGTGTSALVYSPMYLLRDLIPGTTYDVYVYFDCGDDGVVTTETPTIASVCPPEDAGCIDFSDWNIPEITCYYGSFDNPYQHVGVVDNGPNAADSRHTLHYEDELDPRTANQLHTIPPCELYSVRLGNWSTGSEAESITYDFQVDTAEASILLLKYAAVLEDPGHTAAEQPRFKFELLDQNNNIIDPTCGAADYIANSNLGWNAGTSGVLWKDWTFVGTDLSNYHGQTIRIRLTTYDCDQSGHFGYAYFNLNCKKKVITAETCGEMLQNTYTAPSGFSYRWYYQDAPNTILSTAQSLTIDVAGHSGTLCCQVISLNNSNCFFVLRTSIAPRYPLASLEAEREGCTWTYDFNNTSTITADGVTPIGTGEPCETAHWDFGDGTTSDEYSPTHEFPGPGNYNVRLISCIGQDECQDTTFYQIDLLSNVPQISGNFETCVDRGTTLSASGGNTYTWLLGTDSIGNGASIFVNPEVTTTYALNSFAADGCLVSVSQEVVVHELKDTTVSASICQGEIYDGYGFSLPAQLAAGNFTRSRVVPNQYGCDSTVTLELEVRPLPDVTLPNSINHCFDLQGGLELRIPDPNCESYMWSSGQITQSITVEYEGTYSITAVKENCENTGEVTVLDVCPLTLYFPNTITPGNHDGLNDCFQLSSTKDVGDFQIYIYNRYGELVYATKDPNFKWKGEINGEIYRNVLYNYVIFCTNLEGRAFTFRGSFTVL